MALTEKLDIPNRPEERTKWSARFLFPARAMASALTKVFVTPFDFLLGLLVLAIVVVEVASDGSWMLYMFSTLVLAADVFERHFNIKVPPTKEEKPKE